MKEHRGRREAVRGSASIAKAGTRCWVPWPRRRVGNKPLFAGGLFVKSPKEPSLSRLVTEEDIRFYVQQFKKSGFRYAEWCPGHERAGLHAAAVL